MTRARYAMLLFGSRDLVMVRSGFRIALRSLDGAKNVEGVPIEFAVPEIVPNAGAGKRMSLDPAHGMIG